MLLILRGDIPNTDIQFVNSELVCGTLDKGVLGGGTKNGLFYILIRDYSADYAAICMGRLAKLSSRWISSVCCVIVVF